MVSSMNTEQIIEIKKAILATKPNRYKGTCVFCEKPLAAGEGTIQPHNRRITKAPAHIECAIASHEDHKPFDITGLYLDREDRVWQVKCNKQYTGVYALVFSDRYKDEIVTYEQAEGIGLSGDFKYVEGAFDTLDFAAMKELDGPEFGFRERGRSHRYEGWNA